MTGSIHGSNYLGNTKGNGGKLFLDISLWEVLVVLKRTGVLCFGGGDGLLLG